MTQEQFKKIYAASYEAANKSDDVLTLLKRMAEKLAKMEVRIKNIEAEVKKLK
jgi:hypothetical protein